MHPKMIFVPFVLAMFIGMHPPLPALAEQTWTKNLKDEYGFHSSDKSDLRAWTRQQGVRFITHDLLAVYQVFRTEPPELQARGASGGAGSFRLKIVFFDARDGRELKRLEFPTNAEVSSILPTHNGQFLVRTGEVFYLYSAAFEQLSSKPLPRDRSARLEWWEINVTPSGENILLAHHRYFKQEPTVELHLLNSNTLQEIHEIPVSLLVGWSVGDNFIVSSMPPSGDEPGIMNFTGQWITSFKAFKAREDCPHLYWLRALANDRTAQVLCNRDLFIRDLNGKSVYSRELKGRREVFHSIASKGNMLAAAVEHSNVDFFDTGKSLQPLRIELYDLTGRRELPSVKLKHPGFEYDVSSDGSLAIVDGEMLSLHSSK
jgi:hypothetical protein